MAIDLSIDMVNVKAAASNQCIELILVSTCDSGTALLCCLQWFEGARDDE